MADVFNILKNSKRLNTLKATELMDSEAEESFDRLTRLAARVLKAPMSLVSLVDEKRQFFKSCVGLPAPWSEIRETPLSHSYCKYVVMTRQPLIVRNSAEYELVKDNLATHELNVAAYLGIPIITSSGDSLGSFCVIDTKPRNWSEEDIENLTDLAASVVAEVELRLDVKKIQKAEEQLEQQNASLRAHTRVIELAPAPIILRNLKDEITYWNKGAEVFYGWNKKEALGKVTHELFQTDFQAGKRDVTASLKESGEWEGELIHTTKSGEKKIVLSRWGLHTDPRSGEQSVIEINHDITQLKEVDRLKSEFVSIVSHELRTPLTSLRGSLGLLCSGKLGKLSAQGERMVQIASQNTERLIRLINDILDVEKMEAGTTKMEMNAVEIRSIIKESVHEMTGLAKEHGITVQVTGSEIQIMGDRDRLIQTFTNLLSNAIKFSPPKGTVVISSKETKEGILVAIQDEGRGIPKDKLESIFEKFHQVDSSDSRLRGGTGLGLAISKMIVQQHGGRIWVESEENKGSTFYISLPFAHD